MPTNDDPKVRTLEIREQFGLYKLLYFAGEGAQQLRTGGSLEDVLAKAAPDAPPEYVFQAAQVLEGLLKDVNAGALK
jgi:hypothetical protein